MPPEPPVFSEETKQLAIEILDRIVANTVGRTMLGNTIATDTVQSATATSNDAGGSGECQPVKGEPGEGAGFTRGDPYKVLISTVLSVRNKDAATEEATDTLFAALPTPEDILNAPREQVEQLVRRSGMYKTKAARVQEITRIILEDYNGEVPREMDQLLELPGVGRKVANCVLVYAFNEPAIPVDTHVHRIMNRLGILATKTPEQTEMALRELYPRDRWCELNEALVLHGQQICKPIGPLCPECPVEPLCVKRIEVPARKKRIPRDGMDAKKGSKKTPKPAPKKVPSRSR